MPDSDDLADKLRKWLLAGGYPTEMRVAQAVRNHGGYADQSRYFSDPGEGKLREIDVVAYFDRGAGPHVHLVIECKASRDKPWLVFCTDHPIRLPTAAIRAVPATPAAARLLERVAEDPALGELAPFNVPGRAGYAVATGFKKPGSGADPAYAGIQGVVAAATATAHHIGEAGHNVAFPPVIVLDTPLFTARLPEDSSDPVVERTDHVLVWHPGPSALLPVNILTESALDGFLTSTNQAADRLAELATNGQ